MAYATLTELAEYLGVDEADLPDDAERLLERASEMMDYYTLNKIEAGETASKAVCAQVEQWVEVGSEGIVQVQGVTIGPFQAQFGAGQNRMLPELANRAKQYLILEGLLYRGVDIR